MPTSKQVYADGLRMWYELCPDCRALFEKWRETVAWQLLGLVRITALPKQVSYELTGQGANCLTVGLYKLTLAHAWRGLTWRGYDAGLPVHARAEEKFCIAHQSHDARPAGGPDRCSCGGLMCGCGAHYPRSFLSELPHGGAS